MAFTLTYDQSDDPEALSEAEARDQESYEIGEQLEREQQQLLAGKFQDAEDLEQAYIELQRKLGDRNNSDDDDDTEQETEQETEQDDEVDDEEYLFLERLSEEAEAGEFSEEVLEYLESASATDIANMFLQYKANLPETESETYALSDEDVLEMKNIAGGERQYDDLVAWASQNLSEQEIDIFDSVMDKGDPQAIYFAIQAMTYKYQDANGTEGRLLTGTAARSSVEGFRSQAEVVRAMNDPRYDTDPAYRQDVYNKLERSNINF